MKSSKQQKQPVINGGHESFTQQRIAHWNHIAIKTDTWHSSGEAYARRLIQVYQFLVPPDQRVLEVGCGQGNLLAALAPAYGLGIDFSPEMVERARVKHPELNFVVGDGHNYDLGEQVFDYIILSDLVNDAWDVHKLFKHLHQYTHPGTRIIVNCYSQLWEPFLKLAQNLNLAKSTLLQNWLTREDIDNLLYLAGFQTIRNWEEVLLPLNIPLLAPLCNNILVRFWPFRLFALSNFVIARPATIPAPVEDALVSVVVPARNEEGNIPHIFSRVPAMGKGTELIFVEGNSKDNTYQAIEEQMSKHPQQQAKLYKQSGVGKGDAVREGFKHVSGDVIMILDADLTVPPEDLPFFYQAIISNKGEFINGTRLVYPMEKEAMRFLNLIGNKLFTLLLSWLIGQPIKDTLCGTKVFWKSDYDVIAANRSYFGDFDPFGDFDLIFGAAKLNRKLVDLPIRYRERTYGDTNINRWRHGWLLVRMTLAAAFKLKFI